jgi:conjugal transfer pilus assembly protein TraW
MDALVVGRAMAAALCVVWAAWSGMSRASEPNTPREIAEAVRQDVDAVEARARELSEDEQTVEAVRQAVQDAQGAAAQAAKATMRDAQEREPEARTWAKETAASAPEVTGPLSLPELLTLGETGRVAHGMVLKADAEETQAEGTAARYRLYVSRGMGETAMKAVVETARAYPDMAVVFRGVLPGQRVMDLIAYLSPWLVVREGEIQPNVVIDPRPFSENDVTRVPRLERLNEDGEVVAAVHGVINPRYLEDKLDQGAEGVLADAGPVSQIAEEDLIAVIRRRLEAVDWAAAGKRGVQGLWRDYPMVDLPHATQDRRREHDPSVVIAETITAPDGTVLALAGQRINPFDSAPFNLTLVVIDGTVREQLVFARELVRTRPGGTVMVVTTKVSREHGWDSYGEMVEAMQQPVYLLQEIMVERFGLEKVPAVIEGGDRVLVVSEYALSRTKGNANAGG